MARSLSALEEEEFRLLSTFCEVLWSRLLPLLPPGIITPETDPRRIIDRFAAVSRVRALKGLRDAANDLVEMTKDLQGSELKALNDVLTEAGTGTITHFRKRRMRRLFEILRRRRVDTAEEYRMLSAELSDTESPLLSSMQGERIMASYAEP